MSDPSMSDRPSFPIPHRERWRHATSETKLAWRKEVIAGSLAALCFYGVAWIRGTREGLMDNLIGIAIAVIVTVILVPVAEFCWNYVRAPRKILELRLRAAENLANKLRAEQPPPLPPITGNADLLIYRLNIDDMNDLAMNQIHLGVFIRTLAGVTDIARTISGFVLELYADDAKYSAQAEREIGDYYHVYECKAHDERGHPTLQEMCKETDNLLALVRTTPIAPYTQAEGWLRFELRNIRVGHGPQHGGRLKLYALDFPLENRYELNTEHLQIKTIDSSEYAALKRRR